VAFSVFGRRYEEVGFFGSGDWKNVGFDDIRSDGIMLPGFRILHGGDRLARAVCILLILLEKEARKGCHRRFFHWRIRSDTEGRNRPRTFQKSRSSKQVKTMQPLCLWAFLRCCIFKHLLKQTPGD
jgi:hypothetical protein